MNKQKIYATQLGYNEIKSIVYVRLCVLSKGYTETLSELQQNVMQMSDAAMNKSIDYLLMKNAGPD